MRGRFNARALRTAQANRSPRGPTHPEPLPSPTDPSAPKVRRTGMSIELWLRHPHHSADSVGASPASISPTLQQLGFAWICLYGARVYNPQHSTPT
ncbi:MAG: hypothetical protein JWR69_2114, partial [Pedosphaera sp.]|nr:hypothetical protein [Pedosphaera sp.]